MCQIKQIINKSDWIPVQTNDADGWVDSKGRKQGSWIQRDLKGNLIAETEYFNDTLDGISKKFNNLGEIVILEDFCLNYPKEAILYFGEGKINPDHFDLNLNGLAKGQGQFFLNKPNGFWRFWDQNNNMIASGEYNIGIKKGLWKYQIGEQPVFMKYS